MIAEVFHFAPSEFKAMTESDLHFWIDRIKEIAKRKKEAEAEAKRGR